MRIRLRRGVARLASLALAIGVASSAIVVQAPLAHAAATLNGGGSSFAALEIDQWRADTARAPYNLSVNYVSQGSSFGRQAFIDGNVDFGASDIIFQPQEIPGLQSKRCGGRPLAQCFVYVPVSAGGLALMYNLRDAGGNAITDLRLTRRAACKVFTGAIKKWNDPELVATNPRLASLNRTITPIIRADGAGESYVFSEFCIAVAPDVWKAFIADRIANDPANVGSDFRSGIPVSNWPQGWGAANAALYADGVANTVADPTSGANTIGYVAAGYAKVRNMPVASMQNAAGVFTQPDETNVTVALQYAKGRGDGTFILNFTGADPRAYFPSTYSYILAQTTAFDASKGAALGMFLCYAVGKGQTIAPDLRYARLSQALVQIAVNAIVRIPGAPPASTCAKDAPPPPPPPTVTPGSTTPQTTPGGTTGPSSSGPSTSKGHKPGSKTPGAGTVAPGSDVTVPGGDTPTGVAEGQSIDAKLAAATPATPAPKRHDTTWWYVGAGALAAAAFSALRSRARGAA